MGGAPDQDDADGSWIRGAELSETQPQGAPGPGESAASPVSCWRCQLEYAGTLEKCPHCGAQKRRAAAASQTVALSSGDHRPLGALIWAYSIMLGVGLALVGAWPRLRRLEVDAVYAGLYLGLVAGAVRLIGFGCGVVCHLWCSRCGVGEFAEEFDLSSGNTVRIHRMPAPRSIRRGHIYPS